MQFTETQTTYIKDNFSKLQNLDDLVALFCYVAPFVSPQSRFLHSITPKSISYWAFFAPNRYKKATILKKNGKVREISMPIAYLKLLQKCLNAILNIVFSELITKEYPAYGFIPNRNIVQNANQHINRNFVFNIDLENFFGTISFRRVKTVLQLSPFNLSDDLAFLIANLCCNEKCLPQGSPTSPVLSNIVCQRLDRKLRRFAKENHAKYTRYADDLTFSSKRDVFSEDFRIKLTQIIESEMFIINKDKTRLQTYTKRQTVTGLTVNEKVNVSQAYIRELRAMLHNWEKLGYWEAEAIFKANYANSKNMKTPTLQNFLSGKLLFLGLVRGKKDLVYLKYQGQFEKLVRQNQEKELLNQDKELLNQEKELLKSLKDVKIETSQLRAKNIPLFFELFYDSKGVKYLTHDYDIGIFNYQELLKTVTTELDTQIKKYPIPEFLFKKIHHFALEPYPSWSSSNINLGWGTKKMQEWCEANKGIHPSQDEFWRTALLAKFKNSIEFRKPNLTNLIEEIIDKKLDKNKNFQITLIDLEKAAFYTDIDQVRNGLRHIFEAINDYSLYKEVEVSYYRERVENSYLYRKTIKIIDKNSIMNIVADTNEFKGDLRAAKNNLRGLCEWNIEAQFNNGCFRLHILNDNKVENTTENLNSETVLGVTHFLHFYS
jgi:RNA-directed DNA polymerase